MRNTNTRPSIPTTGVNQGRGTVRGQAVKVAIIKLKCETNMTTEEIATAIGRSSRWVRKVWRTVVQDAERASMDPDARLELQAWLIEQVKMVISKSQPLVQEHAAYGALVLKAVDQLYSMLGMDREVNTETKNTLAEIAAQVDARSPLVMAKLEKISIIHSAQHVANNA